MKNISQWIPWVLFIGTLVFFSIAIQGFLGFDNIVQVLVTSSFIGIPAVGLAIIMLSGSFDLSFVGVIGIASTVTIKLLETGLPIGVVLIIILIICVFLELINAFMIINLEIHPWLTTIGTMLAYLGLEKVLSKGYNLGVNHVFFKTIKDATLLGLPILFYILIGVLVVSAIIMHRGRLGLRLYAIGGNYHSARKAGINADLFRYISFIMMGVLCWISSIVYVTQLSGYPVEAAYTNQLAVILSVFFGMAISRKNIFNAPGAILGAIFVAFLANGLGLAGVSAYWIKLIEGCLILIVIFGSTMRRQEIVHI
jgi:ribose/xylose/arabinose/galactoside ABC-type transport system permease subunit